MPCDGMQRNAQERREYEAAIEELAAQIAEGTVQVKKNPFTGQVSVSGWSGTRAAKAGWCEGCCLSQLGTRAQPQTLKQKMAQVGLKRGVTFTAANHAGHAHVVGAGHGGHCTGSGAGHKH